MFFQRKVESTTCHDRTASKFRCHAHKGVKRRRVLPFCRGTSFLKHNHLPILLLSTDLRYVRQETVSTENFFF